MPITGQLGQRRLVELLGQLAQLQGDELVRQLDAIRQQVGLDIVPVIAQAANRGPWYEALLTGRAFAATVQQAAVVGQYSYIGLRLATTATKKALIYRVAAWASTAGEGSLLAGGTDPGFALFGAGNGGNLLSHTVSGSVELVAATNAAQFGEVALETAALGTSAAAPSWSVGDMHQPIATLLPGQRFFVRRDTVNITLRGNFWWEEVEL